MNLIKTVPALRTVQMHLFIYVFILDTRSVSRCLYTALHRVLISWHRRSRY